MKQGIQSLMQVLVACWALCVAVPAKALELQITPDITAVNLDIGDTFTVLGRVTNITGVDLRTTDIFLNFSGYPDAVLELTQLLGDPDCPTYRRHWNVSPSDSSNDRHLQKFVEGQETVGLSAGQWITPTRAAQRWIRIASPPPGHALWREACISGSFGRGIRWSFGSVDDVHRWASCYP